MNYKNLIITFIFLLTSCSIDNTHFKKDKLTNKSAFKNKGFKSIIVNKIPYVSVGIAINDRLKKASNK